MMVKPANTLRIATYNVENLFTRARIFLTGNRQTRFERFNQIAKLTQLLDKAVYDDSDRRGMLNLLLKNDLYKDIEIRVNRLHVSGPGVSGRFYFTDKPSGRPHTMNDKIRGRDAWDGEIVFLEDGLAGESIKCISQVINYLDADVIGLVEVENLRLLRQFNEHVLNNRYPYAMVIDGNDRRGIDVGILSRFPIEHIRSNIYVKEASGNLDVNGFPDPYLFNRDCLQVALDLSDLSPSLPKLQILLTHLKSKSGNEVATDPKRIRQSLYIRHILQSQYRLNQDWVVVMGDLNEHEYRLDAPVGGQLYREANYDCSISPLLDVPSLIHLTQHFNPDPEKRWTFQFGEQLQQLDYILASDALAKYCVNASVCYQAGALKLPSQETSDHAPVFADFEMAAELLRS